MKVCYTKALLIFLIFLVSGYAVMGSARHWQNNGAVQKYVAQWNTSREEGVGKPIGWEDHEYLGSPEAALVVTDPVFQEEIYLWADIWLDYSTEYGIEVFPFLLQEIDNNRWSLWDAHEERAIYDFVDTAFIVASNLSCHVSADNEYDRGGSLAESVALWEAAGGRREDNWMESYKQSLEYDAWLNQILDEVADPEGMNEEGYNPTSMEERYRITTRRVELPFLCNLLWRDMLETEQRMTQVAYERYLVHIAEKDLVRATMDSWVVEIGASNFSYTAADCYNLSYILENRWFPLKGFITDVCFIVGFSILLTFLVVRKLLPRFESQ